MTWALINAFFASPRYAVVGASTNPSKFGNRVLKWYLTHSLPVIPINPKEPTIESLPVFPSLSALPTPHESYSISIITPPTITLSVLKEAQKLGITKLWLQPGAEDADVLEWVEQNPGMKVICDGSCILVAGAQGLKNVQSGKL